MATFYAGQTDYIDILNTLATANAVANVGASLSTIDASIAAAATSATNAAISYDAFDDRYLGSKASNPVADNDGQTLLVGAMHWNTTGSEMRVYTGTTWVAVQTTTASTAAATSATNAASSATNAATSATNAASSATNAAGSATTASTQATNAATSATNAAGSATSAASSATTATTKANEAVTSATNAGTSATNAAGSATTASTQATNAATSSTLSQNWATQLATPVSGGEYSAKYWAQQAAAAITGQLVYRGSWSAATATYPSTPAKGDYYKVSVAGTVSSVDYAVNDSIIYNGTGWDKIDSTDSVTSVAGKVGVVTLVKADVGLGNVDNTSDVNKPISSAQATAIATKQPLDADLTAIAALAGTTGLLKKTALDTWTLDTTSYPSATGIGASGTWGININGTVGATTPAAGSFTTLSATGALTTAGLKEDASGNLGLGVVPSAWHATYKVLQVSSNAALVANTDFVSLRNNWRVDASAVDRYLGTGYAAKYTTVSSNGQHQWSTAPSGTAGQPISFTQAMTLDASGNLNIANLTASKAVFTDASKNLTTTGTLGVAQGGTGATTASAALTALGAYAATNPSGYTTNVGDVTLAGTQTLTNKTITETVFVVTGTTPALTATNGAVQTWTLSGASTPTDALTTGQSIILVVTPGANAITWPGVTWTKQGGSGTLPSLFSAGKTMVVLWKVGTTLYGSHLGDTV